MIDNNSIFQGINLENKNCLLSCLEAKKINFQKDETIAAFLSNISLIGIVIKGTANIVRYDYNGNKTIIEQLKQNSVFGELFISSDSSEFQVTATSPCEILFIEYDNIIKRCKKACPFHSTFVSNLIQIMSKKIIEGNEKIEILSNRTIREKLRAYFSLQVKKNNRKTFMLPFSFTDLADYLSIDRSAMMRELKNLKDDKIIKTDNRKITILY